MKTEYADFYVIKKRLMAEGRRFAVISLDFDSNISPGNFSSVPMKAIRLIVDQNGKMHGTTSIAELDEKIIFKAKKALFGDDKSVLSMNLPLKWNACSDNAGIFHFASIHIEIVEPVPRLIIVGASEVGLAIARTASGLNFNIIIVDECSNTAAETPHSELNSWVCGKSFLDSLKHVDFDQTCYVVFALHHYDISALEYCINKPWAYLGILGSKRKIKNIMDLLLNSGISAGTLKEIHAPIGFDIRAQTAEEIAIAALAEIIAIKNQK